MGMFWGDLCLLFVVENYLASMIMLQLDSQLIDNEGMLE